ncbi:MAG: hypothetical protein AAGO57_08045, partial [Pseudomonadota bacterium]
MAFKATHELHDRRWSRNRGVGILLVLFIALVFGLTVVKVQTIGATQGFDHVVRPEMIGAD